MGYTFEGNELPNTQTILLTVLEVMITQVVTFTALSSLEDSPSGIPFHNKIRHILQLQAHLCPTRMDFSILYLHIPFEGCT